MAEFTEEEKRHVLLHVLKNQGSSIEVVNEEVWRELSGDLNKNWMEIRDAYFSWGSEASQKAALPEGAKFIKSEQFTDSEVQSDVLDNGLVLVDQLVFEHLNDSDLHYVLNEDYAFHNGQLNNFQDPDLFQNTDHGFRVGEKKRLRDLSVYDVERLKILQKQSTEELEMKRKEHEKKMKYYSLQIQNNTETHKEKMKIYLAKYHSQVDKLHEIDEAVCTKSVTKRYKSDTQ